MKKPLTRVLVKIIVNGFYREHTGLLLTLFILIFINFFYTSVLNQTHLTQEQIILNALKLVITSVSEPLGVIFLFGICFLYSVKSCQYVAGRLTRVDVQFLYYSSTALIRARQLQSWAMIQFILAIPITVLGLFATIIGFAFGHWIIPSLIPIYLAMLITCSAWYYTRVLNTPIGEAAPAGKLTWLRRWPKPLFSLFLYEIISKKRVPYALTKIVSAVTIALIFGIFSDAHTDVRLFGILSLCSALAHAILIYQSSEFELFYLRFARNFPYGQWKLFFQQVAQFGLLLLPELGWFLSVGEPSTGLIGACLLLSTTLAFRALLYKLGQHMNYYLRSVFGLFTFYLLVNLFDYTELLIVFNIVTAWTLAYRYQSVE